MTPTLDQIRARFPALSLPVAMLENAGGSQVPGGVADAIADYMRTTYVQLGAGYALSSAADAVVARAHAFSEVLVGGRGVDGASLDGASLDGADLNGATLGRAILGPSSSQLCAMLATCYGDVISAGDNVVVVDTGHEANIGPWVRLAARGVEVRHWKIDPETFACPLDALEDLLDERTRVVAIVHVSNLLGEIVDVAEVARRAHRVGARVVVDGVAYAPHRAIDVAAWGVDWYVFSTYKVYGPHMAVLWGRHDALEELTGPNHFFIATDDVPYKFELGGVSHESCAGWNAVGAYLAWLADAEGDAPDRATVVAAFDVMERLEAPLTRRLVEFLAGDERYRVIGPVDPARPRVPTVSFVHATRRSADVVAALHAANIACRNGHMYARRLCAPLGLDPDDGAVRISALHYNTPDEIERVIAVLVALD